MHGENFKVSLHRNKVKLGRFSLALLPCTSVFKKRYLSLPQILNGLEADLNINETELVDLSKIYTSAKKGQEISRANRMALERDVFKHKHGKFQNRINIK